MAKKRYRKHSVTVLVRVSIAVKRQHDPDNSYKGKCLIVMAYIFRGLVYYHHGRTWQRAGKHSVLEKELRVR